MGNVRDLKVYGAREHNLKNIDITIPGDKFVVITGLSGSGKTSLAFDTIYAEGQRRYLETFSAYARQFIGNLKRPDVEKITGLSPVISIDQKSIIKNPRSTVGTITEIYDFLRLLFARASEAYSWETGKKMVKYSDSQITSLVMEKYAGERISVLAPVVKGRKGHYRELFEQIRKKGFISVRIDDEITEISFGMQLDRYKVHDIDIVIDKMRVENSDAFYKRLHKSIQTALNHGKGNVGVLQNDNNQLSLFSKHLMCVDSGIAYHEPEPNTFSFNSSYGACSKCNGLGRISVVDLKKIVPNENKSVRDGGLSPLGTFKNSWIFKQIESLGHKYDFTLDTLIKDISEEAINVILYGSDKCLKIDNKITGISHTLNFEGLINFINNQFKESPSHSVKKWVNSFMNVEDCPECLGARLKKESMCFKIGGNNIAELANMDLIILYEWFENIDKYLDEKRKIIAKEIVVEIKTRLSFLIEVGLHYIRLDRSAKSLSGGETQRIRLATQIGSKLTNVLYVLDEPSIGLHQRDNLKLIKALKELKELGNSVIVVEHDKETILSADYVIDMGPGAGVVGGEIVAEGTPKEILEADSLTSKYLNGNKIIEYRKERRKGNGCELLLFGASGNNLKNIELKLPLGMFVCVTGVSGSGKSTLINETLYPVLAKKMHNAMKMPLPYDKILGHENIDKVINISQAPIGKTPRSNPATYIGVFDEIRKLFAEIPESKIRGYKPGRFSFNVKGGRCETCKGAGVQTIEMNFLPDVYVVCEDCNGKRYNKETLEIRYKGKSINDVLNLSINMACRFFEKNPAIVNKILALQNVGLGYITLGQSSTTLSGGEAQRVKLASELSKRETGKTLYFLDEPTTGLHFEDVKVLMDVLNALVDKGNSVVVIEHNMEVIKCADYVVDLGPEGGEGGGQIVCMGTPEQIARKNIGFTAKYLLKELETE